MLFYLRPMFAHRPIFQCPIRVALIAFRRMGPTEKATNRMRRFQRVLQPLLHFQRILVFPTDFPPRKIARRLEVGDHQLHRPFGQTNRERHFAQRRLRMRMQIKQDVRVIREEFANRFV